MSVLRKIAVLVACLHARIVAGTSGTAMADCGWDMHRFAAADLN